MYESLIKALATVTEEVNKPPTDMNRQRLTEALNASAGAVKALKAAHGADGPGEFEAFKHQVQTQIDAMADQVRAFNRLGLKVQSGGTAALKGLEDRIQMLNDRRAFPAEETAERFAAWYLAKMAALKGREVNPRIKELADAVAKDDNLSTLVAAEGEILLPDEFVAEMIRNVEAVGRVFPRMRRVPLFTLGATSWPKRTGGLTAYPTAASADLIKSRITLTTINLQPVKWGVLAGIPNEFYRSRTLAPVGQFIAMEIVYALAYAFDDAVVNGDGTADYGGITGLLQSANITDVTLDAHDAGNEVDAPDLDKIDQALDADYAQDRAAWLMSLSMAKHCKNIRDATTGQRLVWDQGGGGMPPTINGYPFQTSNRFPARGSVADADVFSIFGDLALSHFFGVLQDVRIDESSHAEFQSDVTLIRGLAHVDCKEADVTAIVRGKTHA